MLMENTDFHARTWHGLVNLETGRTLHLAPGDAADVDVPEDFTDPFLKPAKVKPKKNPAPEPAATPDESKE